MLTETITNHPLLDLVHETVETFGAPAVCAAIYWAVTMYNKSQQSVKDLIATTHAVNAKVDLIKDNHLAHVQTGLESMTKANEKQVELLTNMDKNIAVLVDRNNR